jgi:hypothetical protein
VLRATGRTDQVTRTSLGTGEPDDGLSSLGTSPIVGQVRPSEPAKLGTTQTRECGDFVKCGQAARECCGGSGVRLMHAVILYGLPAAGKDTVTKALTGLDAHYVLFQQMKAGPGRRDGYTMTTAAALDQYATTNK